MTSTTELALEADARWIKWAGVAGGPWRAAQWVGVVVVVAEIAGAVIVPATDGVDKARWVKSVNDVGKRIFWVVGGNLTPAFIINDLENMISVAAHSPDMRAIRSLGEVARQYD